MLLSSNCYLPKFTHPVFRPLPVYYPIDQGREDIDLQELKLWMTTLGPSQAGNRAATQVKRERPDRDPSTALKPPPAAKKAKDNVGVPNAARRSSVPVAPAAKRRRRTQRGGKGDDNNDDDEEEEEEEEDDDSMVENEDPDDGGMPSRAASRPTAPSAPKGGASKAQGEGRGSKGGSRAKGPATNAYEVPEGEPSTTEGLRTHGLAG